MSPVDEAEHDMNLVDDKDLTEKQPTQAAALVTAASAPGDTEEFASSTMLERAENATCEEDARDPGEGNTGEAGIDVDQDGVESELSVRLDAIEAALSDLTGMFRAKIDRSEYELETLRKQSDEIQEYRAGLYDKLTTPLLQGIMQVHSGMMKTVERFTAAEGEQGSSIPVSAFEVYCGQLEDLLTDNGVERFSVVPGDAFVSGEMRIIGKLATSDKDLIGTVAEVASGGYRHNGKSLSPARVKVYVAE